jgi:zinc transport system permease protein
MTELLLYPLLAGLVIALVAGPLGCFVVWNRMAYFGDTLAHSALLGVSLSFLLSWELNFSILLGCFAIAALLLLLNEKTRFSNDTLLGIFAHGSLALGLVLSSFIEGLRLDLMAFLFGDLLMVDLKDLLLILAGGVVVLGLLLFFWRPLLSTSVHAELAEVEGINTRLYRSLLMFLLATVVAFAIKIVGVILITALLIIPAASARLSAKSPVMMAVLAALVAVISVLSGLALSFFFDTPAGPSIVLLSFILFLLSSLASALLARQ